jgi:N-acetylglucosaminyldiphosphoundecaprenol N-acetyl-beta-D-mannosaminyltransferase
MKILNVKIDSVTRAEALAALESRQLIFTPNPEIILEAESNKRFRRALKKASLMIPDGHGLLFVSTLQKIKCKVTRGLLYLPALLLFLIWKRPFRRVLPEVIHGSDFMKEVVEWAAKRGLSVFFLGAAPGVAQKAAYNFQAAYPNLKLAGFSSLDPSDKAFEAVKRSGTEVLFVAYGAPKQEMWLAKYASRLPRLHTAMAVGGSFDFWSGQVQRAPKWMRVLGLEWLYRLILSPRQRIKRIWHALVVFPVTCLFSSSS